MPCSKTSCCKRSEVLTLEEYTGPELNTQLKKNNQKKNHGENNNTEKCMVPKKIQYRKQMESMMQLFYYPSRSLHSAHSTFYILPYVQLTNWDDKNSVCFTAYIFNLHSEILQQKSAGSCDKNNLYVLRDASFFKPYL